MSTYSLITIIYNPNSTGPSQQLAERLRDGLRQNMPKQHVELTPTQYAGHAEELAYQIAVANKKPLIISASGDGGYHEVVNGLMRASAEGHEPIAGLLPAGNANDHYTELHTSDLLEAIQAGKPQSVDLLKLSTSIDNTPYERFAHSYIGFGLTPKVGLELNKTDLNWFREIHIVSKVLFFLRPIRLIIDGTERTYDSLICSNIRKMSKILELSKSAKLDDGLFEITSFRRRGKLRLIYSLLRASTLGLQGDRQAKRYEFYSTAKLLVQLDGEVQTIDPVSKVTVTNEHKALCCIV